MNALYKFLDDLLSQQNLVSQLKSSVLFATDNWNIIFGNLEGQNELLKKIIDNFPAHKASDFKYSI